MDRTAVRGEVAIVDEETSLARAAAAGDGSAFATLYERYELRVFNFAYRVVGSEADAADAVQEAFLEAIRRSPAADLDFRTQLFIATRNACNRLVGRGEPTSPGQAVAGSPQEKIREANMQLPERQRKALALRELEDLSYEEIAMIMETDPGSVAKLISRARINLDDELRGTVLASVAAPSPECERALPLIAMREDGQLEATSSDAAWLDSHLGGCDRCRLAVEAMREADSSYRAWAPIAAVPWLLGETMAKAAELIGADWSSAIAEAAATRAPAGSLRGTPPAYRGGTEPGEASRRRMTMAGGLAALLLSAGLAALLIGGDDPTPAVSPAAGTGPRVETLKPGAKPGDAGKPKGNAEKKKSGQRKAAKSVAGGVETTAQETSAVPLPVPVQSATGGGASDPSPQPDRAPAKTAVQPTQQPAGTDSSPKRKPAPTRTAAPQPAPAPAPAPAPVSEEPPAAEEPSDEPPRRREPPGKPADRPPR